MIKLTFVIGLSAALSGCSARLMFRRPKTSPPADFPAWLLSHPGKS